MKSLPSTRRRRKTGVETLMTKGRRCHWTCSKATCVYTCQVWTIKSKYDLFEGEANQLKGVLSRFDGGERPLPNQLVHNFLTFILHPVALDPPRLTVSTLSVAQTFSHLPALPFHQGDSEPRCSPPRVPMIFPHCRLLGLLLFSSASFGKHGSCLRADDQMSRCTTKVTKTKQKNDWASGFGNYVLSLLLSNILWWWSKENVS